MSEFYTYHAHVREKKEEQIKINGNGMECITMATSCRAVWVAVVRIRRPLTSHAIVLAFSSCRINNITIAY